MHTCVLAADTSRFTKSWPRVSSHGVPFSSLGVPGSTTCSEVRPDGERSDPNSVWGTPKAGNADNELLSRGVCCSETDTLKSQSLGELLTPMHRGTVFRECFTLVRMCVCMCMQCIRVRVLINVEKCSGMRVWICVHVYTSSATPSAPHCKGYGLSCGRLLLP